MFKALLKKTIVLLPLILIIFMNDGLAKDLKQSQAIPILKRKIENTPTNANLYLKLSQEYMATDQPKLALKYIEKAIELEPQNIQFLMTRGILGSWLDNLKLMQKSYSMVLEIEPDNTQALLGMANALSRQGQYKQSTLYLEKYLEKKPQDKQALVLYINLAFWQGKSDIASQRLASYKKQFGMDQNYQKLKKSIKTNFSLQSKSLDISVASLKSQIKRQPQKAKLYARLANVYAAKQQPLNALQAINKAALIEPNNISYLRLQVQYAYWADDIIVMKQACLKILRLKPNDPKAILSLARAESRLGYYATASHYYEKYFTVKGYSKIVMLEYVNVLLWQEDYRKANKVLVQYKRLYGEDKGFLSHQARVFAAAGWSNHALKINKPLLSNKPSNYYFQVTQTTAYRNGRQPQAALKQLDMINKLQPSSDETLFMNDYVKVPLKSNISLGGNWITNSQTVKIGHTRLDGDFFITPTSIFQFETEYEWIASALNSPLVPVTGGQSTNDISGKIGIYHRLNPQFALGAKAGWLDIYKNKNAFIYDLIAETNPNDQLSISYQFSRDLFRPDQFVAFSPRSISLAIMQSANLVNLYFEPSLNNYLRLFGSYSNLSDGNSVWEIIARPTTAIIRKDTLKVDVGVSGNWYSFKFRANNGYYSPTLAQLYLFITDLYYGVDLNRGISFTAGIGAVKDETFPRFYPAADLNLELTAGIYKQWQLKIRGGYSYRGNHISPYTSPTVGAVITRRIN